MNPAGRVLLDTSVVMHLIRGNEVGQRWIGAAAAATDSLLITNDRDFDPLESHLLRRVYVDPAPARS